VVDVGPPPPPKRRRTSPDQIGPTQMSPSRATRRRATRSRTPRRTMKPRTVNRTRTPSDPLGPTPCRRPRRTGLQSRAAVVAALPRGPVSRPSTASILPLCARGPRPTADRLAAGPHQGRGPQGISRRWQLTDRLHRERTRASRCPGQPHGAPTAESCVSLPGTERQADLGSARRSGGPAWSKDGGQVAAFVVVHSCPPTTPTARGTR
jgi:hypothetical protein